MVTANPSRLVRLPATAGHEHPRGAAANLTVFETGGRGDHLEISGRSSRDRRSNHAVA
jgi:hypothetical protein